MRVSNRSEGSDGKFRRFPRLGWLALAAALALVAAGCSSSSSSSAPSASGSASATGSATVPAVSINSFTVHIAPTMSLFKALTAAGTKGANSLQVGVVLPDTTSSTRWVDFDQPYLKQAFTAAGYTSKQFRIDNAQGSDATQLSDATADINLGAKILIVCPLDGPTGVAIAKLAQQKGVTLIAYDRAIFEGTKTYYVSFDNEHVGELIGTGFTDCVKAWGPEWRPGHRPQRHLLCYGLQQGGLGKGGQDSRRGGDQQQRRLAGWGELRPWVGQHQGRHHLPAGVHRSPADQRHYRGQ